MFRIPIFLLVCAIALMATIARAQTAQTSSPTTPPSTTTQPPPFRSAFDSYQRFDPELPLTDWRKVHETVQQRGGWRAYAMASAKANAAADKPAGENK